MARRQAVRRIGGDKDIAQIPRCFRPRLNRSSQLDLGLAHWQNLDALHKGEGTTEIMWQIGGGVLTWFRVADQLKHEVVEMGQQAALFDRVVEHCRNTGRVEWPSQADYELARAGAETMDRLALVVDAHTALQAAIWSEDKINALADEFSLAAASGVTA